MDFNTCIDTYQSILMEGALGERLKREYNLKTDGTAGIAELAFSARGADALKALWHEYLEIAENYGLPFLATTPTRRANRERARKSGFGEELIYRNAELLKEIKKHAKTPMFIGGLMGCKGDSYTGSGALSVSSAEEFHSWQANLFKRAEVDFLYSGIMPCISEAMGMANAMAKTGLPYIISFTLRCDGKLIDGTPLCNAIRCIDIYAYRKPAFYMANCVHPCIVLSALFQDFNRTSAVKQRFLGIQANTSSLSYSELDNSADLKCSPPDKWTDDMMCLKRFAGLKVLGGCCGTDSRHIEQIAKNMMQIHI